MHILPVRPFRLGADSWGHCLREMDVSVFEWCHTPTDPGFDLDMQPVVSHLVQAQFPCAFDWYTAVQDDSLGGLSKYPWYRLTQ